MGSGVRGRVKGWGWGWCETWPMSDLADEGKHVLLAGLLERDAEQALRVPPRLEPLCLGELTRARDRERATLG